MTLSERQKNDNDSNKEATVEDLQLKLDVALERIKKQEYDISTYEAKLFYLDNIIKSAENMALEIETLKKMILEKNQILGDLRKSTKRKMIWNIIFYVAFLLYLLSIETLFNELY